MGQDYFGKFFTHLDSPAEFCFQVTPVEFDASNTDTEFAVYARNLYVGGAGDVEVVTLDDQFVVFSNVQAGTVLPIRCKAVNSNNTTANSIVGMY